MMPIMKASGSWMVAVVAVLALTGAACGVGTGSPAGTASSGGAPTSAAPDPTAPPSGPSSSVAAAVSTSTPTSTSSTPLDPVASVLFSVSVQDFARPDESAAALARVLDLHESLGVPVDIYLTDTMAVVFAAEHPDLWSRLLTSPVAALSYHVRPPRPYAGTNDWYGLAGLSDEDLLATVGEYESFLVDPATGRPTAEAGGFAGVADLAGRPPLAAASASGDQRVDTAARSVYAALGATFTTTHGRPVGLGATLDGLIVRPEHAEDRVWEHVAGDAVDGLDTAVADAVRTAAGEAPFVGVKIHDNDFFATESAWVTVYVDGRRRPDWDPTLTAPLLSEDERAAAWAAYEETVRHAVQRGDLALRSLADPVLSPAG